MRHGDEEGRGREGRNLGKEWKGREKRKWDKVRREDDIREEIWKSRRNARRKDGMGKGRKRRGAQRRDTTNEDLHGVNYSEG